MSVTRAQIMRLITFLDNAVGSYRKRSRVMCEERLPFIGLETEREVLGVKLRDIMTPVGPDSTVERLMILGDAQTAISNEACKTSRGATELRSLIGRDATSYVTLGGTTAERHTRLLWVFGNSPGARVAAFDKAQGTLLIDDGGTTYGVERNVVVGGQHNGLPVDMHLDDSFFTERVNHASGSLAELHRLLRVRLQGTFGAERFREAWDVAVALRQRSLWDNYCPFESIAELLRYREIRPYREDLVEVAHTALDPLLELHRLMVGRSMTIRDFRWFFGQLRPFPLNGDRARTALVAKLYMIPFLRTREKKKNDNTHRHHRESTQR